MAEGNPGSAPLLALLAQDTQKVVDTFARDRGDHEREMERVIAAATKPHADWMVDEHGRIYSELEYFRRQRDVYRTWLEVFGDKPSAEVVEIMVVDRVRLEVLKKNIEARDARLNDERAKHAAAVKHLREQCEAKYNAKLKEAIATVREAFYAKRDFERALELEAAVVEGAARTLVAFKKAPKQVKAAKRRRRRKLTAQEEMMIVRARTLRTPPNNH